MSEDQLDKAKNIIQNQGIELGKLKNEITKLQSRLEEAEKVLNYLKDIRNNAKLSEFSSSEALQDLFDIVQKTAREYFDKHEKGEER